MICAKCGREFYVNMQSNRKYCSHRRDDCGAFTIDADQTSGYRESIFPGKEADCEMDPADPDWNGLETGVTDDSKDAIRSQLAFLVKYADHSAHTIIRSDYLLKDPSFI